MENWKDFVESLSQIECVAAFRVEAFDDWGDDIPITVLFSYFGRGIARRFCSLSEGERDYVFEKIEAGVTSENTELAAYVATGLLEAMYSEAIKNKDLWEKMENFLQIQSKAYLKSWLEWGG
ncbi:hypothetical protein GCM10007860_25930 [Chitiniphilus shinanonensis]|uniref:Uncharacterized protein n=1 Tax=Chitiniphilus shinanonensis TaxID=553088 RepID=A0ABQ6BTW4_9NEIS|nr:hypothetical protein [Chitiniphilus shinanonensis]GLS05440.1 hypothetical protein GCM10007860_25930 [Chitiniphilus shinanonensis]